MSQKRRVPTFDLAWPELLACEGRDPPPDDVDGFWDEALAELDGVAPRATFTPAPFTAGGLRFSHVECDSVSRGRIHARLVQPVAS